jgi:hypothetical protein
MNFCLEDGTALNLRLDPESTLVLPTPEPVKYPSLPSQRNERTTPKLLYVVIALLALLAGGGLVALLKSTANETARTQSSPPIVEPPAAAGTPLKNQTPASRGTPAQSKNSLPTGIWIGRSQTRDQGETHIFPMTINFAEKTANDGECRNQGRILSLGSDLISIEWPECGRETVKYSIVNDTLSAQGETIDIRGNVNRPLGIKRNWSLARQ